VRLVLLVLFIPLFQAKTIRVATYNVALSQSSEGRLAALLRTGTNTSAKRVAEVVQIVQPDVLLVNEFDYDANGTGATRMNDRFFNVSQNGRAPQNYPYRYVAVSNTGIHSGFDLDNNGVVEDTPGDQNYGGDAFGFGEFPGKFAMVVFSKYPIDTEAIRTFEEVLWKDMPGNLIPPGFYTPEEQDVFRVSSKSHWDVPIEILGTRFHFLVSHPTPPVFDGPEDRNGRRNHDEIRLWADYLTPGAAEYLGGGLGEGERFVIAGDQNADPTRGDSVNAAINQLLNHPRVSGEFVPKRTGDTTTTNQFDTATFRLRVDYVLPSKEGFKIEGGGVFWPSGAQEGANLVTVSDHRLVYLDLKLVPLIDEVVRDLSVDLSGENLVITWVKKDEVSYRLEKTNDLDADEWERLDDLEIDLQGDLATATLPPPTTRGFFRIVAAYE
jgi:endonuclease/exonuclease/phosphatase family metal-dependent hydrolase